MLETARVRLLLLQPQLSRFQSIADGGDNFASIRRALEPYTQGRLSSEDILVLPEHWDGRGDDDRYLESLRELSRQAGCHVVGGTFHQKHENGHAVNAGAAVDPEGHVVARYEKLRPYATERQLVEPGTTLGEFTISGRRILVLVCADFWFSDLIHRSSTAPDLILVPALSVTRKSRPDYSRAQWRHLSVCRAYEFGVFVGISDWGHPSELGPLFTSGVAGLADPTQEDPEQLFAPVHGDAQLMGVDFEKLAAFQADRRERGFFWK